MKNKIKKVETEEMMKSIIDACMDNNIFNGDNEDIRKTIEVTNSHEMLNELNNFIVKDDTLSSKEKIDLAFKVVDKQEQLNDTATERALKIVREKGKYIIGGIGTLGIAYSACAVMRKTSTSEQAKNILNNFLSHSH